MPAYHGIRSKRNGYKHGCVLGTWMPSSSSFRLQVIERMIAIDRSKPAIFYFLAVDARIKFGIP